MCQHSIQKEDHPGQYPLASTLEYLLGMPITCVYLVKCCTIVAQLQWKYRTPNPDTRACISPGPDDVQLPNLVKQENGPTVVLHLWLIVIESIANFTFSGSQQHACKHHRFQSLQLVPEFKVSRLLSRLKLRNALCALMSQTLCFLSKQQRPCLSESTTRL